ncbi:hypothetical protein BGX28_009790 [Mortierella sp. GBA30]|nr:hypothetical protein BGX28_009790 [Mortierella sp. GBA30]
MPGFGTEIYDLQLAPESLGGYIREVKRYYINSTFPVELSSGWSKCPIQYHADVCVRREADMSNIKDLCGSARFSLGTCHDRVYGMILTVAEAMEDISEYTNVMVVQGSDIGELVDAFVQTRSRWVIDPMGGNGYEILTSFVDPERIALHKELDQLQHRCDRFFHGGYHEAGFGSQWHMFGLGLARSVYHNMTFVPRDRTYNYLIPITSCTEADMAKAFAVHPPETDFSKWDALTVSFESSNPLEDMGWLLQHTQIIKREYEHKGHFWWRSLLTYYVVRPNAMLRRLLRESPRATPPCISIHVRHSDKSIETSLLSFDKYMEKAYQLREKSGATNIYLMTDDDEVVEESKAYRDFEFQYMDMVRTNKGWKADRDAGVSMDDQEKRFLMDLYSATQCQQSVVTYSSNVGRLMAEVPFALRNKPNDVWSLDENWVMWP